MKRAISRFVENSEEAASAVVRAAYGVCRKELVALVEAGNAAVGRRIFAVADTEADRRSIYEGWAFVLRTQAPEPIRGVWNCEGHLFHISKTTYQVAPSGPFNRIAKVERHGGDYQLVLADGYRVSLLNLTGKGLTWHSPVSGDTFECSLVAR